MKRLIIFVSFILLFAKAFAVVSTIDLTKNPQPPPPVSTSLTQELPVSAFISETELSVYFESTVGDATITVYDADNNVVYQETVDTDLESSVFISSSSWSTGGYSVTITYGTTSLIGYFDIE